MTPHLSNGFPDIGSALLFILLSGPLVVCTGIAIVRTWIFTVKL